MIQGSAQLVFGDSCIGSPEAFTIGNGGVITYLMHEELTKFLLDFLYGVAEDDDDHEEDA